MDSQARFKETYDDCILAAKDPAHHVLVVHMWENGHGLNMDETSRQERFREVDAVLGIMAGNPEVCYNDTNYFASDNFPNRVQRGGKAGLIGIACSPLINGPLSVFPGSGDTGIILKEPTPVFVSYNDAWSVYYEKETDIPAQEAWDTKCRQTGEYKAKSKGSYNNWQKAHSLLRDDPEARKTIAGKLAILRTGIRYPGRMPYPWGIKKVLNMQNPEESRSMPPYLLLDPHSPQVHARARRAYEQLLKILVKHPDKMADGYTEVDVNATLANAAGILVNNRDAVIAAPVQGEDAGWSETLKDKEKLAVALYQACVEHGMLSDVLRKKGISYTPTVIIHQPESKNIPLVHFPPTQNNKLIVERALKQMGYYYNLPTIDEAIRQFSPHNDGPSSAPAH